MTLVSRPSLHPSQVVAMDSPSGQIPPTGLGSTVFTIVVIQAFFHAGWNFAARKVKGAPQPSLHTLPLPSR